MTAKPKRYKAHLCDCGKLATVKRSSGWMCRRCADLGKIRAWAITVGVRGARHADVFTMPGSYRK